MERTLKGLLWQRAAGRCEYCQLSQEQDELTFEINHIIARKHRGPERAGNLCLASFACNNHKDYNIS